MTTLVPILLLLSYIQQVVPCKNRRERKVKRDKEGQRGKKFSGDTQEKKKEGL
jgi:hypothetical protein